MKVRVLQKKNGKFYSEYFCETSRGSHWASTYENLNSITQNGWDTLNEAIVECNRFAEEHSEGKIVWQGEV